MATVLIIKLISLPHTHTRARKIIIIYDKK